MNFKAYLPDRCILQFKLLMTKIWVCETDLSSWLPILEWEAMRYSSFKLIELTLNETYLHLDIASWISSETDIGFILKYNDIQGFSSHPHKFGVNSSSVLS